MDLFPIGTLSSGSKYGTVDSVSYSFFEPNLKPSSLTDIYSLLARFQNKTMLARKKASANLTINYEYENIYAWQQRQIEHFLYSKDDAVTSFFVVDLSKGELPTVIDTSSTWTASIPNTRLYSTTPNMKSNYCFFYNGNVWKVGTVTTVNTNISIVCNVDTNNYGSMTDTQGAVVTGNRRTMIYPIYQCFASQGSLGALTPTDYWPNNDSNRGWRYSGTISFTTKYRV